MNFTRPFSQISRNDANSAGGKGASLGELVRAGIPVPDGFVVLAETFEMFLKEMDLVQEIETILATVNHEAVHTSEEASSNIRELILSRIVSEKIQKEILESLTNLNTEFVAVRSSATAEDGADHAWAGQLESYLNVTRENVIAKVQECWASLFTPRAIFYRFEKGLHNTNISVAVVVQTMVNSEKSGIAFSVHPVTEDHNQMIIEAGFGLGETIVSGSVTPDSYVVEKEPRRILDINISNQNRALYRKQGGGNEWIYLGEKGGRQVLNESQILELSALILRIESHYGFPCDIEWAYEDGTFFITQSRPITTLRGGVPKKHFIRLFTRERGLLYGSSIYYTDNYGSDVYGLPRLDNVVIYEKPNVKYLEVWYDEEQLDRYYEVLSERIESDPDFYTWVVSDYKSYTKKLNDRIASKEKVANVSDLLDEYQAWFAGYGRVYDFLYIPRLEESKKAEMMELREKEQEYPDIFAKYVLDAFKEAFPDHAEDLWYVDFNEARALLCGESLDWKSVRDRKTSGYYWFEEKTYPIDSFKQQIQENHWLFKKDISTLDGSEIKGETAYGGFVTGKCCLVMERADIEKVQEGDIIVAISTYVDFIPALMKASALITDEGGIACHAAIVSRELKKPCIVGLGNATEILHDGDMVEVDADNGIVKILDQKKSFKKEDYMLSFWVQGVSVFVTDIYLDEYKRLDVLYVIDQGIFKQYFTHKAYNKALDEGLVFYSSPNEFEIYKSELLEHCKTLQEFFLNEVKGKETFSIETVKTFFSYVAKLCGDYTKMNFEYTDKAFLHQEENPIIKKNLEEVAVLKDHIRAVLNTAVFEHDGYTAYVFSILGKQFGIEVSMLDNLTQQEILELFHHNQPDFESAKKRQQAFVEHNDKRRVYEGKDAEKIIQEFREVSEVKDVFSGQVASKGNVTGTVKIIPVDYGNPSRVNSEIENMNQGDILVAETTAPELIIACKKAAAIVTDMGGLMSHAAIVSREFGIPCIVGTKDASKVLKDGDKVEVDADNGVVKVLNRAD